MSIPAHWRVTREPTEFGALLPVIEIPGIATVRHLTDQKLRKLRKVQGPNADVAFLAFPAGLTLRQFKKLPVEQRSEIRQAVWSLMRM